MNRKTIITLCVIVLSSTLAAQDLTDAQKAAMEAAQAINGVQTKVQETPKPKYWTNAIGFDLGLNQTSLTNWAAGGYNTLTLAMGIDGKADYAKDLMTWGNRLQLNYGFLWSADKRELLQKSNDRIYLESKWGYKTAEKSKWSYSAAFDFRSQFSNSFDNYKQNADDGKWYGDLKSGFLSPAYTNIAVGMMWVPCKWFDLNVSPITGGFTVVANESLRKNYGMALKKEYEGQADPQAFMYRSSRFQFGAQIKANVKVNINDKFKYETQLVLFTDYLNHPFVWNRVNWDNGISWQPAKFFKIALNTWLIYDPLVTIKDKNGVERTSLVQFKEFLSLNFTYSIATKKK